MNLQIPTDSIPKFFAVFGLALVVCAVGFCYVELEKQRDMRGQLAQLETLLDFHDKMSGHAVAQYEEIKKEAFDVIENRRLITASEEASLLRRFKARTDELSVQKDAYISAVAHIVPRMKQLRAVLAYTPYYFFAAGVLLVLGIAATIYGFRAWHLSHSA